MIKLNYFNNTGGINLFSSVASMNQDETKTDWSDAKNMEIHKSGGIAKMQGCKNLLVSNANGSITGIINYNFNEKYYPLVSTSEGKLFRLDMDRGTLNEVFSAFDKFTKTAFVNYNNGVIITNGQNKPVFYEEGKDAVVLSAAPEGLAIEVYRARVFIAKGSTLYYSALGNQNDWSSADDSGFICNFHNDSSPIIALRNYGEYLAIYKKNSTYVLQGSSPADYVVTPVCDKGATSPWVVNTIDNKQYFFSGDSITPLIFNQLGQISLSDDISIKIRPLFNSLDKTNFKNAVCVPYRGKNQIWFYFSSRSQELDVCYIWDYFHNCWYVREGLPVTCADNINGVILSGTSDGKILIEDLSDSFDGKDISSIWLSPWFNFGHPEKKKELLSCNVWIYNDQKFDFEFLYSKDYEDEVLNSVVISAVQEGEMLWDNGTWDDSFWVSSRVLRKSIFIPGQFETLRLGFRNKLAGQPFKVIGYSFEADLADG